VGHEQSSENEKKKKYFVQRKIFCVFLQKRFWSLTKVVKCKERYMISLTPVGRS
jgi:hypothetical protein